jgi:choice-of-anchor B domain-containing protein
MLRRHTAIALGVALMAAASAPGHPVDPIDPLPDPPGGDSGDVHCEDGFAVLFPCRNVDLLAWLPLGTFNQGRGNDLWGWTDPVTGREIAILGLSVATVFVDISEPRDPVYLGRLPGHTNPSSWRDIKVYADHAFVVSEAGAHGMQVFDLTRLRDVTNPPVIFAETAHYAAFGDAHNLAIDEETGFAYVVGSNTCAGGLHMINVRDPANPSGVGCFSDDFYSHDAQCVVYRGPDLEHQGREICFNSNEDSLTIVDVTNKAAPRQLSRSDYAGRGYTHQGWLTEDHAFFLLGDELDEILAHHGSRTYIWDLSDLDAPAVVGTHTGSSPAIDHNQ